MATARRVSSIEKVERKVIEEVITDKIELTLSKNEAKALIAIFNRVGGSPEFIRGNVDSVNAALKGQVGNWYGNENISGRISFGDITADALNRNLY